MDLQSHIHGCIVTLMILFFLIILYLFGLGLKSSAAHCFDKSTVTVLKPILALGIVLHHLQGQSVILHEFYRWGPLIVGVFFFISGYELTYSFKNKPNYLHNFFVDRVLLKLLLPYVLALFLELSLNWHWVGYSLSDHIFNSAGPSLFSNDWFMFALFYCYLIFALAGHFHSDSIRLSFIFIGVLSFVLFTAFMGYGRNWWATPMAFSVGTIYQYNESAIIRLLADKKNYILSNLFFLVGFGLLISLSFIYKHHATTVMVYSLLPLWIVTVFSRLDLSKMAKNKYIIWGSNISFELFLVHGIIIDFLKAERFTTGIPFVVTTLLISICAAFLLNLTTKVIKTLKVRMCK